MPVLIFSIYVKWCLCVSAFKAGLPKEPKASPGSLSNFQKQLVGDRLGGMGPKQRQRYLLWHSPSIASSNLWVKGSPSQKWYPCICTGVQINRTLCLKCPHCCQHPSTRTWPSVLSSSLQPLAYILPAQNETKNRDWSMSSNRLWAMMLRSRFVANFFPGTGHVPTQCSGLV